MRVKPEDGRCRECGGQLEIVDADDAMLQVVCVECGVDYCVETDAFGDGCMTYYPAVMLRKFKEGGEL